jgi:hypothetical protein
MADYEYTNTRAKSFDAPDEETYTLTFNGQERQIFLMALGELLGSVTRSEHLTPAIQALITRVESAPATADRGALRPNPQNRTGAED